jgi:hypothetical protein
MDLWVTCFNYEASLLPLAMSTVAGSEEEHAAAHAFARACKKEGMPEFLCRLKIMMLL